MCSTPCMSHSVCVPLRVCSTPCVFHSVCVPLRVPGLPLFVCPTFCMSHSLFRSFYIFPRLSFTLCMLSTCECYYLMCVNNVLSRVWHELLRAAGVCDKIIGHRSEYTSEVVPYTSSTIREGILPRMAGEYFAYYLVCSYLASLLSRSL